MFVLNSDNINFGNASKFTVDELSKHNSMSKEIDMRIISSWEVEKKKEKLNAFVWFQLFI